MCNVLWWHAVVLAPAIPETALRTRRQGRLQLMCKPVQMRGWDHAGLGGYDQLMTLPSLGVHQPQNGLAALQVGAHFRDRVTLLEHAVEQAPR